MRVVFVKLDVHLHDQETQCGSQPGTPPGGTVAFSLTSGRAHTRCKRNLQVKRLGITLWISMWAQVERSCLVATGEATP